MEAVLLDVQNDAGTLVLRFEPVRGDRTPIEDRLRLDPEGELASVRGVGRVLRILRAGRIQAPQNPYGLANDPEAAAELLRRCEGAHVTLQVSIRTERILTIWTESSVERIGGVVDFGEDVDELWIRRKGGGSVLRIPRRSIVRFASSSQSRRVVISVEVPTPRELQ